MPICMANIKQVLEVCHSNTNPGKGKPTNINVLIVIYRPLLTRLDHKNQSMSAFEVRNEIWLKTPLLVATRITSNLINARMLSTRRSLALGRTIFVQRHKDYIIKDAIPVAFPSLEPSHMLYDGHLIAGTPTTPNGHCGG